MSKTGSLPYARGDHYQAVELPYKGKRLALDIIVPDRGGLASLENGLSARRLDQVLARLSETELELTMPKFTFSSRFQLKDALSKLGMQLPFSDQADFAGMSRQVPLKLKDVVHQANVKEDEKGTEAAAATGAVVQGTALQLPRVRLVVDHPFVFLLRDRLTGAPLFLGRVVDPSRSG